VSATSRNRRPASARGAQVRELACGRPAGAARPICFERAARENIFRFDMFLASMEEIRLVLRDTAAGIVRKLVFAF